MCPLTAEELLALVSSARASEDCRDEWAQPERFSAALYAKKANCPQCKAKAAERESPRSNPSRIIEERQKEFEEIMRRQIERSERREKEAQERRTQEQIQRAEEERRLNESRNTWRQTVLDQK